VDQDERKRDRAPAPPASDTDRELPDTWGGEGGAGDYAGGPVTSSGTRKRQGPPGSKR
jgi:hypothetical protein